MKKILLTTLSLLILVLTPLKANAFDWGNFFRWLFFGAEQTQVVSTDDLKTTLSDLEKKVPTLDATVEKSFLAVVPLLTSEKDLKSISSEVSTIKSSNSTDAEKDALFIKVMSNYTTTIKGNKVGVTLIIKTLKDADKTTLKNEITKISKAAEEYYNLSEKASTATSKVAKDSEEEQIKVSNQIDTINKRVKNKAKAVSEFSTQVKILSALAGLNI